MPPSQDWAKWLNSYHPEKITYDMVKAQLSFGLCAVSR